MIRVRNLFLVICVWALTACGGLVSQSAALYNWEGEEWLVMRKDSVDVSSSEPAVDRAGEVIVAVRQQDGSYTIVASSLFGQGRESFQGGAYSESYFDNRLNRIYVSYRLEGSITRLFELITRNGAKSTDLIPTRIQRPGDRKLVVPAGAVKQPKAEREEGGMY